MKFKNSNGEWQNVKITNYCIEQTPIGSMIYYPSQIIPKGYLVCDGTAYLINDYPELFKAIGYIAGEDVDEGYFRVPDMRGNVPAGYYEGLDSSPLAGEFGDTVGDSTHTLTVDEIPSHNHTKETTNVLSSDPSAIAKYATGKTSSDTSALNPTNYTGGGQPHSIVQPTKLYHWLIKAKHMVVLGGYTEDFNVDGSLNVKGDLKFNDVHLNDLMNEVVGDTLPIGSIVDYDGDTPPENWVEVEEEKKEIITGQECATNEYIDGKRVYEKNMKIVASMNNEKKSYAHGITGATRIWIDLSNSYWICPSSDNRCLPLQQVYYTSVNSTDKVGVYVEGGYFYIISNGGWGETWEIVVRFRYIKASSPTPV